MKTKSFFFIALLVASTCANAYTFTVNGLTYKIIQKNTVFVATSVPAYTGSVIIPSTVTHNDTVYNVTDVDDWAFRGCQNLTDVTFPNSITSIGGYVFQNCDNLNFVTLCDSLKTIGTYCFTMCPGMKKITIPKAVNSIGAWVFYSCKSLSEIRMKNSVPVDLKYSYGIFDGVDTTTCILYVPVGSKSAYQSAFRWSCFKNIVEDVPTGIACQDANELNIHVLNGEMIFSSLPLNETVLVTDVSGKVIYNQEVHCESLAVRLPAQGSYLVRVGNKKTKVLNL